jgi:hypothetical protein
MDEDVTQKLIDDCRNAPGEKCGLVMRAKPAKELTPKLSDALLRFMRTDGTMGYTSKPLAYSSAMPHKKSEHTDLIRLIKGGFIKIYRVFGPSLPGTAARRDSPFGNDYYYQMKVVTQ